MREPIANVDMANAWDGEEGDQWTQFADEYDTSMRSIWGRYLEMDPIAPTDRVLDIGCGSGQSTRDAARLAVDGSALGVDLSESMLAEARRRASTEGLTNVEFLRADVQVHAFAAATFDLAISRFGSMFFSDRPSAFSNIASALRPGGRMALLVWQAAARNEWIMVARESMAAGRDLPMPAPGAPGPAALADPDDVEALLTGVGFEAIEFTSFEEPLWFGADADAAYAFVGGIGIVKGLSEGLEEGARAEAHEKLKSALRSHETPEGVRFDSAVWLITARKP